MNDTTEGTLLGGRVHHAQSRAGHRSALEPVLLAASIPARPGQRAIEGGTGAASALLCLAARLPGITGLGLERNPAMATIAQANIAANGFSGLAVETTDLTQFRAPAAFDHALANPPWHAPAATASPDAARDEARRATPSLFVAWAAALAATLRHRGTLSWIIAADHLAAALAAHEAAGCASPAIFPFWPKPGRPARLVILRSIRGGRGPARMLAGMTLHRQDGGFTREAEQVLRDGQRIEF
jgi:tRNA1Val (adenine37-N6)-methyltransferase